jgi:hypothetical protein
MCGSARTVVDDQLGTLWTAGGREAIAHHAKRVCQSLFVRHAGWGLNSEASE